MKRIFCVCIVFLMLFSSVPFPAAKAETPIAAQTNSSNNTVNGIFYGVIPVLVGDRKEPEPFRAARDEDGNVFIHLGDFAEIVGGTMSRLPQSNIYTISYGNWEMIIYCEQMGMYLQYRPEGCSGYYDFLENGAMFSKVLYHNDTDSWYLPMDELLYLSMCSWICEENYVTVIRPQTILDLIPTIKQIAPHNPSYADLMGESVKEQYGNAFKYGFYSAIDEIDATFIVDYFCVGLGFKDSYTFEEEILKKCLLLLADDSPYEGEYSGLYNAGAASIEDFNSGFANAALILEVCPPDVQVALTQKLTNFFGMALSTSDVTKVTDQLSADSSFAEPVADLVFSVAEAYWTQQYLQDNFGDRLLLIQEWTKNEKENKFGKQLYEAAKSAYNEYYGNFLTSLAENAEFGHAIGLVNAAAKVKALNTPMLILTLFDFTVETLKKAPVMENLFEEAETAHDALDLINLSSYIGNATTRELKKLHDPSNMSIDFLEDLRVGCQISQNAAMHAQKKLLSMGKAQNKSTQPGTEFLLAVTNSAKFDGLLMITGDYADLYCDDEGCVREQIPPEYVYAGDGVFLSPVNQVTEAPRGFTAIETAEDLKNMKMSGNYILMEDLEIEGWTPLGDWDRGFSGIFDGNGHSITINLSKIVDLTEETYGGLFNYVSGGTVKNLHMKGTWTYQFQEASDTTDFTYDISIGSVAAHANGDATIFNCVSSVDISCDATPWRYSLSNYIAGIVGDASNYDSSRVRISYCRNLGNLTSKSNLGGIVCQAQNVDIYACQNDGKIDSNTNAGGIVYYCTGTIKHCANRGDVTGMNGDSGGIAYSADYIENCLNAGSVFTEGSPVGYGAGIVASTNGTVRNCVNIGTTGRIRSGICGNLKKDGIIRNCYWIETELQLFANVDNTQEVNGAKRSDGEMSQWDMTDRYSFSGFNFMGTWTLYEDMKCPYPSALLLNGQKPLML